MELRTECRRPDTLAAKTISERHFIDWHVCLRAHFCKPALHQHHAYWNITQQGSNTHSSVLSTDIHGPQVLSKSDPSFWTYNNLVPSSFWDTLPTLQSHQQLASHQKCQTVSFKHVETNLVWSSGDLRDSFFHVRSYDFLFRFVCAFSDNVFHCLTDLSILKTQTGDFL